MEGMRTRTNLVVVAAGAMLPLLAAPVALARTTTVRLQNVTLSRDAVRIEKGDTVRWLDEDRHTTHTVTSKGRPDFRSSGTLRAGDIHRVRFNRRGRFAYVCTVHPASMRGEITVV